MFMSSYTQKSEKELLLLLGHWNGFKKAIKKKIVQVLLLASTNL